MRIVLVRFVTLCTTLLLLILVSCSALAASGEIVYENVTMNSVLAVDSGKTLTMELKGENFFNRGISVPKGSTLIIKGNGSMKAQGTGFWGCGIGGNNCGTIIIESGNITAGGGTYGYAIGGESFEEIQINGGTVIANGANRSTTIGGINASGGRIYISDGNITVNTANSNGIYCGDNGTLFINGGTINVQGGFAIGLGGGKNSKTVINDGDITSHGTGNSGAAIGGGEGNTVTINGGIVNAICDTVLGSGGAAIGGGKDHIVTINRGNVTAQAGYYAAAIGGNAGVGGGTITINGGTVTAIGSTHDGAAIGGGQNGDGGNVIIRGGTVTAKFGIRYKDTCPDVIGRGNGGRSSGMLTIEPHGTAILALVGEKQTDAVAITGSPFSSKAEIQSLVSGYKYFRTEGPNYTSSIDGFKAERDGWSLINYYNTFEYDEDYDIPVERWNEVYGISIGVILNAFNCFNNVIQGVGKGSPVHWGGNCNGLSLLAATNFTNQIDLRNKFDMTGNSLYDYGYEKILNLDGYSIKGVGLNSPYLKMIERAQICQASLDFLTSEVYRDDIYYSSVINHLDTNLDSPLLVKVDNSHTMVIDTSKESIVFENNWIVFHLYDSNAPIGEPGILNAHPRYRYEQSLLFLNTKNGDWASYYNGKQQRYGNRDSIKFYDVTKLDASLLRCITDGIVSKYFRLFTDSVFSIFLSGSNVRILKNNTPVVEIIDDEVGFTKQGVSIEGWAQESDDISANNYYTYLPNSDYEFELEDSMITFFMPDVFGTIESEGKCLARYDTTNNSLSIESIEDGTPCFISFALQNNSSVNEFDAIRVDTMLNDSSISLQKMIDGSIYLDSSNKNTEVNIYLDNSEDDIFSVYENIPIKNIISIRIDLESVVYSTPLSGKIEIIGRELIGEMLLAAFTQSNNTGNLTYTWKRDGVVVGTGEKYTLTIQDIGKKLTCEVTSTVETGCITATTEVIAKQAGPAAPTDLIGVEPTSFAGKDGKIIGTTVEMELSDAASFASVIACGSGETGSLTAGTYYVRYKETETTYAGEYATVIVPEYIKKPPIIHYPESNQIVNVEIGQTANLSVVAENGIDYQWFVDRNDGKGYVELSDAGKESYSTAPVKKDNDGYCYFCRVSNADGMTDSCIFTLCVIQLDSFPETGDRSNLIFWMIVVAACSVTICLLVHKQKAE